MRIICSLLFLLLASAAPAHSADSNVSILKAELSRLNLKHPEIEARNNLAHGKNNFIGLYGFTTYFPGVADSNLHYVMEVGADYIKGTSDGIESGEHERLIEQARSFAQKYNEALLVIIKKNEKRNF